MSRSTIYVVGCRTCRKDLIRQVLEKDATRVADGHLARHPDHDVRVYTETFARKWLQGEI